MILSFSESKYFAILFRACNFWFALIQILVTCSLKFSLLSIVISKSLTDLLPMISSSPILMMLLSLLIINKWHLSLFDFISFILNQVSKILVSFSRLSIRLLIFDSIAYGVLSSA